MARRERSIADHEIALIRAMLLRDIDKTKIQAYFTHPDRPVNYGRVNNIEQGAYGYGIDAASDEELDRFLANWTAKRGAPVDQIVEAAFNPADLPPIDPRRISSLFFQKGGNWFLKSRETDEIECKQSFSLNPKVMRAIAALANNRGGYVFFGVIDATQTVVGLLNDRFEETDPNRFSQAIRSAMEPTPRVEITSVLIGRCRIGAIYVHRELDGPVIASKTEQELREGTIYFRYPGESKAIGAAEFRKMLAERDARVRHESSFRIARLMDLGPRATVVDIASTGPEATKIVREGIDEADVLRNFVRQERVEFPLAYLLRSCSTARSWLPIFYYLQLSGMPLADAIKLIEERETSYVARKRDLLARLRGEKVARGSASGRVAAALKKLLRNDFSPPEDSRAASDVALAMVALKDSRLNLTALLILLRQVIDLVRSDRSVKVDVWSSIYKAAARIDELYYRPAGNLPAPNAPS